MSMQSRYRFTTAWLPDGWHRNVVISVDPSGDMVDIATEDTVTTARLINGAAIAGMPNVHSHAFQRAMVGLAEQRGGDGDSFWTWRETMYDHASRMTPDCLNAIAAQLYADMLKAGYTSVCEFHYLHSHGDNRLHADRLALCQSLIDAAATAGIGMTLLPTLYQTSDGAAAAVCDGDQRISRSAGRLALVAPAFGATGNRHGLAQPASRSSGIAANGARCATRWRGHPYPCRRAGT
jgi:formimidoylglutamate deiminase